MSTTLASESSAGLFEGKPDALRALYAGFAAYAKEALDPRESGIRYVTLGAMANGIMLEEHRTATYLRHDVSRNIKRAAEEAGVPDSLNKPHEFIAAYWLAKLDLSTPGSSPDDPRILHQGDIPPEWFEGDVTYGVLRKLFPCIHRTSNDTELDAWDFNPGWEPWVRDILVQVRTGGLSANKIAALYSARKDKIETDKPDDSKTATARRKMASKPANDPPSKPSISPVSRIGGPTANGLATTMTLADARDLVQCLAALWARTGDRSRLKVIETLRDHATEVITTFVPKKLKAMQEQSSDTGS
jgi:hypothetical protein